MEKIILQNTAKKTKGVRSAPFLDMLFKATPSNSKQTGIFNYLLNSSSGTWSNYELAKKVDTSLEAVRSMISQIRRKYRVNIIADEFGKYHMTVNRYTYQDNQLGAVEGKKGRPRHVSRINIPDLKNTIEFTPA
tara:strand:+ start:49 stop:450 length:402 start_codon:yes stop_codon:yes gene_type:complete